MNMAGLSGCNKRSKLIKEYRGGDFKDALTRFSFKKMYGGFTETEKLRAH